jgi:aminoglycoside 3-N-acetyltransferase
MVTRDDIRERLRRLGLGAGNTVVVHSSLSSFGRVEGGAATVVDALLEVLGPDGTLIVPTFNFEPGVFDPRETPSIVGKITEEVRLRPNAVRSHHPTHSVAAIGRLAEAITEGHERVDAFGRGSALFKALQAGAKILQLGTNHTTNSMIHVAEEIFGVPYLDRQRQVGIVSARGKVVRKWVRRPGCSQGFDVIEDTLEAKNQIAETMIGNCRARLMTARAVVDAAIEALRCDPEALLCDRPDCGNCAEARAMIAALDSEKQDKEVIEMALDEERTIRLIEQRLGTSEIRYFEPEPGDRSPN